MQIGTSYIAKPQTQTRMDDPLQRHWRVYTPFPNFFLDHAPPERPKVLHAKPQTKYM